MTHGRQKTGIRVGVEAENSRAGGANERNVLRVHEIEQWRGANRKRERKLRLAPRIVGGHEVVSRSGCGGGCAADAAVGRIERKSRGQRRLHAPIHDRARRGCGLDGLRCNARGKTVCGTLICDQRRNIVHDDGYARRRIAAAVLRGDRVSRLGRDGGRRARYDAARGIQNQTFRQSGSHGVTRHLSCDHWRQRRHGFVNDEHRGVAGS